MSRSKKTPLTQQVIRMDQMPDEKLEILIEELTQLDQSVFEDLAPEKTKAKFRGKGSDESWILTIRDQGKLIGYNCIRVSFLNSGGRRFALWNSRSAMGKEYRGQRKAGNFAFTFFFRFRLRFPFIPIRGLITLIHPSSFKLFSDRIPKMFPTTLTVLPPKEAERFQLGFEHMKLESVAGKEPFVVKDTTITRTEIAEREFWARSKDPALRFFHEHNQEFPLGQAIATYFPISSASIGRMALRQLSAINPLRRLGLRLGISAGWGSRRMILRKVPLLSQLPADELSEVLKIAKSHWLKSKEILFRQGEKGRKLFIPLKGSLMVEKETRVGFYRIAQLQVGDPAGEFGFLKGTPRNATVRAFGMTHVLSIDRKDLERNLSKLPCLKSALFNVMEDRMMDNESRNLPPVPEEMKVLIPEVQV